MSKQPKYVYFIRPVGRDGPVKIGCSDIPTKRLHDLSTWSPFPLELVVTTPGSIKLECLIHGHFIQSHSHREWFHSTPELRGLMDALLAGKAVEDFIDLSKVTASIRKMRTWTPDHSLRHGYHNKIYWASRRYAGGGYGYAPDEIDEIMDRWSGNRGQEVVRPTEAEFALIDAYLASAPPLARAA